MHDLVESVWLGLENPGRIRKREWRGHDVLVEIWLETTDALWNGGEPFEEGCTGWDLTVRVSFREHGGRLLWSGDSICGIWIQGPAHRDPWTDKYVQAQTKECEEEALALLGPRAAGAGHVCSHPECLIQGVMGL